MSAAGRRRRGGRPIGGEAAGHRAAGQARGRADDSAVIAGGVAYYAFLAIFPALAAVILIYGLFADPTAIEENVALLSAISSVVRDMLSQQLTNLARQSPGSLSVGVGVSNLSAVGSATKGMKALRNVVLKIVYNEEERRGFFR